MKVERSCFLILGAQYIRALLKQESKEIKIKIKKENKRQETTRGIWGQFEQEKRIMELEKINAIRKRAIKEPRQFDIRHGLNKTTSINYSASILRLHRNKVLPSFAF